MIKNIIKNKLLFFLILCITNSFFILPPTLNIGDQALVNLHVNEHLLEFKEKKRNENFRDFYLDKYSKYFENKLKIKNHNVKYGISLNNGYIVNEEEVKTLNRFSEFILSNIFLNKIEMEKIFVLINLIILVLTFYSSYLLGKLLFGRKYGIILSTLISSNIYFNQLLRSSSEEQTLIYPLLFCLSFYFLIKIFYQIKYKNLNSLFFGICLSFCLLNGYPNTILVLLPFLIIFLFSFSILNNFNFYKENYSKIYPKHFLIIFISFISLTIVVSIIWSLIHNYHPLTHIYMMNTRFNIIFSGQFTNESYLSNFSIFNFLNHIKNLFNVIFFNTDIYYAPHEPQYLFKLSYINLLEGFFLFLGLFFIIKNLNFNNFSYFVIFIFFIFFIIRSLTDNLWLVGKINYDFYFLIHFFSAYGIFEFSKKELLIKICNNQIIYFFASNIKLLIYKIYFLIFFKKNISLELKNNSIINNKYLSNFFNPGIIIISIILIINSYNFNYYFVNKFNENLGLHSGLYELKNYVAKKIENNNDTLILIDWYWGDIFYPALITDLNGKFNWDVLSRNKIFTDINDHHYYKNFKNVYIITPAHFSTISLRNQFHGGRSRINNKLNDYFSFANYEHLVKDRNNKPIFIIYKINESDFYKKIHIDPNINKFELDIELEKNKSLAYLDFTGKLSNLTINCEDKKINYNFAESQFDFIHMNFNNSSFIEIYNDFSNKKYKTKNNSKDIIFYNTNSYPSGWEQGNIYISNKKGRGFVEYEYKYPFNINSLQISVPYLIYNNLNKSNSLELILNDKTNNIVKAIDKITSDGSQKFGNWVQMPPADLLELSNYSPLSFIDFMSKYLTLKKPMKKFSVNFNVNNSNYNDYHWSTRFISGTKELPENIKHSILLNAEIPFNDKKIIKSCKKIVLNAVFDNYDLYNRNYIIYGYD